MEHKNKLWISQYDGDCETYPPPAMYECVRMKNVENELLTKIFSGFSIDKSPAIVGI